MKLLSSVHYCTPEYSEVIIFYRKSCITFDSHEQYNVTNFFMQIIVLQNLHCAMWTRCDYRHVYA